MTSNFEQQWRTPEFYMGPTESQRVLDYLAAESPNSEVIIYEHWPEPPMTATHFQIGAFDDSANLTPEQWQLYR